MCTKGEHRYAWEMWRLLDPGFAIIPKAELRHRLICLPGKGAKSLELALQLGSAAAAREQAGSIRSPLAVILDDTVEVSAPAMLRSACCAPGLLSASRQAPPAIRMRLPLVCCSAVPAGARDCC